MEQQMTGNSEHIFVSPSVSYENQTHAIRENYVSTEHAQTNVTHANTTHTNAANASVSSEPSSNKVTYELPNLNIFTVP